MNEDSRLAFRCLAASAVLVLLALPAFAAGGSMNAANEGAVFSWTGT